MKQQNKFTSKNESEQAMEARTENSAALEFPSVEEMLRHDAGQTVVPTSVARRLRDSLRQSEAPPRSWWRRLLD